MATDDPEGIEMFERVKESSADLIESGQVITLIGASDIEINALQRVSAVILQKSLREGFGLTVSEAMWKETPVVASRVGGIPLQVIDGETGFLVDPTDFDQCAERIASLIEDRAMAAKMAARGKEHVREHFLMTRLLGHDLELLEELTRR
jgi:trehalose synthase